MDRVLRNNREEIVRIASLHGARNIRVFGSRAREEAVSDSDLDIIAIKQDLEDALGCRVDVVTEAAISPYIREQVLKEAIRL